MEELYRRKRRALLWYTLLPVLVSSMLLLVPRLSLANNLKVANVELKERVKAGPHDHHYTHIEFDISWHNSWRGSSEPANWDAAWVFAKYRHPSGKGRWAHCTLNITGMTAPAGSKIVVPGHPASSGKGKGALIHRNAVGSGNNDWRDVRLRWNYGVQGVPDHARVDVKVFAIEMVYVPAGSFFVGDGKPDKPADEVGGQFAQGSGTAPFQITSEEKLTLGGKQAGNLGNHNAAGMFAPDDFDDSRTQTLPASFPKGHKAFYCMKYEISQGQYADFLNTLTTEHDSTRFCEDCSPSRENRYTITGPLATRTAVAPDRACSFLNWADGAAYADWAALRPMTELEYEKAARGPLPAKVGEFAWGTTYIADSSYSIAEDRTAAASIATGYDAKGNASYANTTGDLRGPLRCGIFATGASGRASAGAGYWGVMELSGNVWERTVTVGNAAGRAFTGEHGDGVLDGTGNANVAHWPSTDGHGGGFRGGSWLNEVLMLRVSDRNVAAYASARRSGNNGFRCVRSAP